MGKRTRNRAQKNKSSSSLSRSSLGAMSFSQTGGENLTPTEMSAISEVRAFMHKSEQYCFNITDFDGEKVVQSLNAIRPSLMAKARV